MLPKKERCYPCKPEWKIILDHLIYQDTDALYRICRKMIIHLDRMKVEEIHDLLEQLNPTDTVESKIQIIGPNWPKPKGSPFIASDIIYRVFQIADLHIEDNRITEMLNLWIMQERIGHLSMVLEKRHVPLVEVIEALKKYARAFNRTSFQTYEERVGLRVSLINRFLSENLTYINIAKHFITIDSISKILDYILGPAYGNGKLGGKSSGLLLAYQIIEKKKDENPDLLDIKTPKSYFLTSDGVLEFIHYNALDEFVFTKYQSTEEIQNEYPFLEYIFKNSHFPPETMPAFNMILDDFKDKPIVVRSSSLLEDSFEASFSGKYKSLFLANTGTREERCAALKNAIAEVYASIFGPDPIEYRKERGLLDFREEMGILIQEVVGTKAGKYYFPAMAGVAFSHNEFRWSNRIKREDGICRLVAGLGTRAVDRTMDDYPTLISPGQPGLKVNTNFQDIIRYSQQKIDVINLEERKFETITLKELIDEANGYFQGLERIVSFNRGAMMVDPIGALSDFMSEDLVITFNSLIENTGFIQQMKEILKELSEAFNSAVDVEFASDGKDLYLLQCRPQRKLKNGADIKLPAGIPEQKVIFTANTYISSGIAEDIEYVVYVDSAEYSKLSSKDEIYEVGKTISRLNKKLPKRKFILIGPGRWGSKGDIKLGVPVIYSDINNTAMLIEVSLEKDGYSPELSFGTHFFQDLVEADIKYLPLYPDKEGVIFSNDFFYSMPNRIRNYINDYKLNERVVKVLKVSDMFGNSKLTIVMDGDNSEAMAYINEEQK